MLFGIDFLGAGILAIIHFIIWAVVMFKIISAPRSLMYKVVWGLVVFLLPCVGVILWYFFGKVD